MVNESRGSVKGSVLQSRLAFVKERAGQPAVDKVLASLPESDRKILTGMLLPAGWYPFETADRLDLAISRELGMGDQVFRVLGEKSATDNLAASHRVYIRDRDPHGLLKQAASIYRLYSDTGHRTYEKTSDKSAILRTWESRTFSKADCLTVIGWHEKAIGLCGGAKSRVRETRCRTLGDEVCEYVCEWE